VKETSDAASHVGKSWKVRSELLGRYVAESDTASYTVSKMSRSERNKRCSEQRGGQGEGTSDTVCVAVGETSTRERNSRCSEQHGGQDVSK
jgi:hypothetical protein